MRRFPTNLVSLFVAFAAFCAAARADEPTAADLEYFEKTIRPLLVKHCYECHGPKGDAEGHLRLDGQSSWLTGGDSGPAIVPGKPEESLFIKAIRYGGDIEMPPTEKLPPEVIKTLEEWVSRGAPAPPQGDEILPARRMIDIAEGKKFWSYRPIENPRAPNVNNAAWPSGEIDRFILAKLEAGGLAPSEEASREVLVRRLYFDLWGLPPTPEQIETFLADPSDDAYEKLVDQLLDSPHFGERFGRHWLDVARFGESLTLRGFILPNAWRYRDYVIGAFHRDLPYDDFVRQQIAGDLLLDELSESNVAERRRRAIAVTFLTLGNNNLEEQDKKQLDMDVVDEQLDVLGKAFLAQTISCARCHDHKFDPIPAKDYYALAGILRNTQLLEHANVSKWTEAPLPMTAEETREFEETQRLVAKAEAETSELNRQIAQLKADLGLGDAKKEVVSAAQLPGIVVDDAQAKRVGSWTASQSVKPYIGDGYLHDEDAAKGEKTLTFAPKLPADGRYEVRLAYTPGQNRTDAAPVTIFGADGEKTVTINMKDRPPIEGRFVSLGQHKFEAAGQSFVIVSNEGTKGHVVADAVQFLPVDAPPSQAQPLPVRALDAAIDVLKTQRDGKQAELDRLTGEQKEKEQSLKKLKEKIASRPMGMAPLERKEIGDCPIHLRGSVHTLGEVAPRGFLRVASSGPPPPMPTHQSGRKELAEWLSSEGNPLTARVYVNRVWHWLFGAGLVWSVDNFGTTGEPPSHPELLDHLAADFMADGWSTKKLIRRIVLSKTYRQSSQESAAGLAVDPENRLLWRMNRKRLEAECLRDAMLSIGGQLDLSRGGAAFPKELSADYGYEKSLNRRSVYLPVFRNALHDIFDVFDFADPSMVVGARNVSTTAPQALYLLNHPFPQQCASAAAKRLIAERRSQNERLDWIFLCCLGRRPSDRETEILLESLGTEEESAEEKWTRVIHALFGSIDFRYRD